MEEWEAKINEMANNFVGADHSRLENLIFEQMKILALRGVLPTWENFTEYGQSWNNIAARLTKENQFRYEEAWKRAYQQTIPTPKP